MGFAYHQNPDQLRGISEDPSREVPHAQFMALAATLLAMVVVGCGGSSDEVGGSGNAPAAASGGSSVKLSLVGYSVAKQAYDEIIPAFNQTDAGKCDHASASPTARRAISRARSSPASRPTSCISASSPTSPAW